MGFYDEEISKAQTPLELRKALDNEFAAWWDVDCGDLHITSDTLNTAIGAALRIRANHLNLNLPEVPSYKHNRRGQGEIDEGNRCCIVDEVYHHIDDDKRQSDVVIPVGKGSSDKIVAIHRFKVSARCFKVNCQSLPRH